jgi:phage baseplate assembly protein gpV
MRLDQFLADLLRRTAEIERRFDGMVSQGTVHEVEPKGGTVRLRIGGTDEEPFLSPPIPYAQTAGALKVHAPPSKGQQMTVLNGSGDFRQGLALPMTWSDSNKSPSEKGDENVLTFGNFRIELRGDELRITVGGFIVSLTADGAFFTVGGITHAISGNGVESKGGTVKHDEKNIGSDHVHGGVSPGGSNTAVPSN